MWIHRSLTFKSSQEVCYKIFQLCIWLFWDFSISPNIRQQWQGLTLANNMRQESIPKFCNLAGLQFINVPRYIYMNNSHSIFNNHGRILSLLQPLSQMCTTTQELLSGFLPCILLHEYNKIWLSILLLMDTRNFQD